FQAEDGIRDFHVTGVQTCALPIFAIISINCFTSSIVPDSSNLNARGNPYWAAILSPAKPKFFPQFRFPLDDTEWRYAPACCRKRCVDSGISPKRVVNVTKWPSCSAVMPGSIF